MAQWLGRQTLNRHDPGLSYVQSCGTLSVYPVFPQFTQLYERLPGYILQWVAVCVHLLQRSWVFHRGRHGV